jgi:hypothetical protein
MQQLLQRAPCQLQQQHLGAHPEAMVMQQRQLAALRG